MTEIPVARANVAYSATFAKTIVTTRTIFSAIGTKSGAVFASFVAIRAYYRTTTAQFTVITEISLTARANVASSAVCAKDGAIFTRAAIFAAFHVITSSAIGASIIVDTVITHAAIFAYKIIVPPMITTATGTIHAVIIPGVGCRNGGKRVQRK